jgi:hypothetical protein
MPKYKEDEFDEDIDIPDLDDDDDEFFEEEDDREFDETYDTEEEKALDDDILALDEIIERRNRRGI